MIDSFDFSVYHQNGINFLPDLKDQFTELFLAHSELLLLIGDGPAADEELLNEIWAVMRLNAEMRSQSIPLPVLLSESDWVREIPICASLVSQVLSIDVQDEHAQAVLLSVGIGRDELIANNLLTPDQWHRARKNICCGALINSMLLTALHSRKLTVKQPK